MQFGFVFYCNHFSVILLVKRFSSYKPTFLITENSYQMAFVHLHIYLKKLVSLFMGFLTVPSVEVVCELCAFYAN